MKSLCRILTMMAGRGRRGTSRDRGRFRPTAEALGARSSPSTVDTGVSAVIPPTGEVARSSDTDADDAETDDDGSEMGRTASRDAADFASANDPARFGLSGQGRAQGPGRRRARELISWPADPPRRRARAGSQGREGPVGIRAKSPDFRRGGDTDDAFLLQSGKGNGPDYDRGGDEPDRGRARGDAGT